MRRDGGEPEGIAFSPNDLECHASLVILCKDIGDYLERNYPGWLWAIQPSQRGGVIMVKSLRLNPNDNWWFSIRTAEVQDDPHLKLARRAAGETLERFGMPRKGYRPEFDAKIIRDPRGNAIADLNDRPYFQQKRKKELALEKAIREGNAIATEGKDGQVILRARV